jgi:hypothetical protein
MKRTLFSTVVAATLLITLDSSTLSAADLESVLTGDPNTAVSAPPAETLLISRGFRGGGGRRGGGFRGGSRRGGGFRSGGARRSGGYRSAARRGGGYRSGGYRSAGRSGGSRTARSGGARRSATSHRSNASHGQNRRSNATHSSKNGHNGSRTNSRNHSGRNGGRDRGGNGGGGWGAAWDAGDLVPVVDVTPYVPDVAPVDVTPVVPDVTPVVVDPRPVVITLLNPAETHAPVNYNLGGTLYTLEAGQSAAYGEETQVIAFDRGGSFGEARYTLAPGTYRFVFTNQGWELNSVSAEVAGENTESTETTTAVSKDNPFKLLSGG